MQAGYPAGPAAPENFDCRPVVGEDADGVFFIRLGAGVAAQEIQRADAGVDCSLLLSTISASTWTLPNY